MPFRRQPTKSRAQLPLVLVLVALAAWSTTASGQDAGLAADGATTLAAQTGNNTSAADTYQESLNGNVAPANVSHQPVRDLLYAGAETKVYAHLMGWFGGPAHIDVGYASDDPAQVKRQIEDMIARGIDGVIIDWYGPGPNRTARTTDLVFKEAELHPGFQVALQEDKGALRQCKSSSNGSDNGNGNSANSGSDGNSGNSGNNGHDQQNTGSDRNNNQGNNGGSSNSTNNQGGSCDATQLLIKHLQYLNDNYVNSPAYMRVKGQPLVFFFDVDLHYKIDWKKVAKQLPHDFQLVFRNRNGFNHDLTNGSFAWVMVDRTDPENWSQNYLDNFYSMAQANPDQHAYGAVYKGFDDTPASWSLNRRVNQDCGGTWLNTFAAIKNHYSVDEPLENVQLVTWNDYEEGTEIETGIDNCVTVSARISGSTLKWRIKGQDRPAGWTNAASDSPSSNHGSSGKSPARVSSNHDSVTNSADDTVDHFTIFVSTDRKNLRWLADVPYGTADLNLSAYILQPGTYYVYLKVQGKPGFVNQMASPVKYVVQ